MLMIIGSEKFTAWLKNLRDRQAKVRVIKQIQRIQLAEAFVGDWKPVGGGVIETRLCFGPGYRIYSAIEDDMVLLLLVGGDKSSQSRDVIEARRILKEWRRQQAPHGGK